MANAKFKRRSEIVRIVREKKQMSCVELSKAFGVTEETIRKDLQELSEKGELLRTFGGAMVREYGTERSLDQRIIQNLEQKKRIAQKAVSTLKSGDLVAMDAGSTVTMMAKAIPDHLKITVLTNSLEICNILSEYGTCIRQPYQTDEYLDEHFSCMIDTDAIRKLAQV